MIYIFERCDLAIAQPLLQPFRLGLGWVFDGNDGVLSRLTIAQGHLMGHQAIATKTGQVNAIARLIIP